MWIFQIGTLELQEFQKHCDLVHQGHNGEPGETFFPALQGMKDTAVTSPKCLSTHQGKHVATLTFISWSLVEMVTTMLMMKASSYLIIDIWPWRTTVWNWNSYPQEKMISILSVPRVSVLTLLQTSFQLFWWFCFNLVYQQAHSSPGLLCYMVFIIRQSSV